MDENRYKKLMEKYGLDATEWSVLRECSDRIYCILNDYGNSKEIKMMVLPKNEEVNGNG